MKINKIEIYGYGKWHDVTFDLNKNNLQLIYGNNESGKTTLLSLIEGILFGYLNGRGNKYSQYIPKDSNAYGGSLTIKTEDNRNFIIKRVAGKYGGDLSIYDLDNECDTDNDVLKNILGPIDRPTFENLFYFGDINIKDITKLSDTDLIERIQKVGFVGSSDWINIRAQLDKESRNLYAPKGRKPPLNQKLKSYDNLLLKINESKSSLNNYKNLLIQFNSINEENISLKHFIDNLNKEIDQLKNHKSKWPLYEKLIDLKPIKVKDGFDNNAQNQLYKLNNSIKLNKNQIDILDNQINEIQNKINKDSELVFYEQNQDKINELFNNYDKINDLNSFLKVKQEILKETHDSLSSNPLPITKDDKNNITDLQKALNNNPVKVNNKLIISLIALGVILLLLPGTLKLLCIALFIISGYLYYSNKNKLNYQSRINEKINSYRVKYNFSDNNIDNWFILDDNYRNNNVNDYSKDINELLSKIENYFSQWKFSKNYLSLGDNYDQNLSNINQFITRNNKLIDENKRYSEDLNRYLLKKDELVKANVEITTEINKFFSVRSVNNQSEFDYEMNNQHKAIQINNQRQNIKSQLDDNEINKLKSFKNKEDINEALKKKLDLQNTKQQHLLSNSQKAEKVKVNIDELTKNGTYQELQQKKANLEAEINDLVDEWLTTKLSFNWINQALNIATADRIPLFQQKAQEYFGTLTNNNYIKITYFKNKLKVTRNDKTQFDIGELSRGTIEQLYLSLLLSLSVVFGRDYKLPIIIDDGFSEFDIDRSNNAFKLLEDISKSLQVIYVTCNHDVLDYFDKSIILSLNKK
ncbi:AAA family ATPase [Apilactobacillus apisilvae]|uniref:AAA family ATPase n=1 Tax=Apilactobacillus apisilvae TaxID=2923364 RepID=A0ABY4PHG2_9LACO|nr:AAA family ATPase [Apilactobacillus apisilvae]UQS85250.1 AAA family ATPase [Apilactobacillus apisilvae]